MVKGKLAYVKPVTAKGKRYEYFITGQVKADGKPILARLPARNDPSFGATYAALLAGRSRRENRAAVLTIPRLIDLFERSPEFRKLAVATQRTYAVYLRVLTDQLASAPAGEITRQDMLLLRDKHGDRTGAANGLVRTTRALYAWARRREHVANDPCAGIELFGSTDHQPWPDDLLVAALASADADVRLTVSLLYFTAQRIGDACALRWSDVRDGFVSLVQEKTGKPMDVRVHRDLAALLTATPRRGMTILSDDKGRAMTPDRARRRLQAWAEDRGYRIVPHGLRKNAVNALLEAGCTSAETAAVSGQSLQMVEHYAKQRSHRKLSSSAILKFEGIKG